MFFGKKNRKRLAAFLTSGSLIIGSLFAWPLTPASAKNKVTPAASNVGISYFDYTVSQSNQIDDATLFIGTYLIYFGGLSGAVYQDAMRSRLTYEQENLYYKSEIDGGDWHDIDGADAIAYLKPGSETLSEKELYDLRITHIVGKDGKVENTSGGDDPFSDPDPYDEGDEYRDDLTDEMDEGIEELLDDYNDAEDPEVADILYDVMSDADATRREEYFSNIYGGIVRGDSFVSGSDENGGAGSGKSSGTGSGKGGETGGTDEGSGGGTGGGKDSGTGGGTDSGTGGGTDSGTGSGTGGGTGSGSDSGSTGGTGGGSGSGSGTDSGTGGTDSGSGGRSGGSGDSSSDAEREKKQKAKDAAVDYSAKKLIPGNTGVSRYLYDAKTDMLHGKDIPGNTKNIGFVNNITDGKIVDPSGEGKVLDKIIGTQKKITEKLLKEGVPSGYKDAGPDERKKMLEGQKKSAQNSVDDMKEYVKAAEERGDENVRKDQKNWIEGISVSDDEFGPKAEEVISGYVKWLDDITDEQAQKKANKLDSYEKKKQRALENNDPATAKKYEKAIENEEKGPTSDEIEDAVDDLFGNKDLSVIETAALIASLNRYGKENNVEAALNQARNRTLDAIRENNPFFYTKYKPNPNMEYVSMGAVDRARRYTRFRYVRTDDTATMSRIDAGLSFTYRPGGEYVTDQFGKSEELSTPVVTQTDPYIRRSNSTRYSYLGEDDALRKIYCSAEYIVGLDYAICVTDQMEELIKEDLQNIRSALNS